MNECKEKLIEAIEKNEFINYLEGKPPYTVEMHQWVSAEVPTDISQILGKGIYELFKEKPELKLDCLFEKALIDMINKDIFDLYMALIIIFDHLQSEEYNAAPFKINRKIVIEKLKEKLKANKKELSEYFEWQGKNGKQGLWSEVIRIDSICKDDFGFSIID